MSQKKKKVASELSVDTAREKWGKFAMYALLLLVPSTLICLIIGWLNGDHEYTKISDTFVTAFMQNYNYILAAICLVPVDVYIFSKIKSVLSKKYITESQEVMYGFFAVILALVTVISICTAVYPINASTYYGYNSKTTVSVFLIPAIILILEMIVYGVLEIPNLIKNKVFWKNFRRNLPIILMVMFLIWTFTSCMLAPEAADDVIGAEKASEIGASPSDVLAKTLNGCYNLKDGFWAFLMYGAFMLTAMLIGKDKIKEKKLLIKVFVIAIMILSLITLILPYYAATNELTTSEANQMYRNWFVFPQRALFRNSNHFAYVLCMATVAAAILAINEEKIYEKILYFVSYVVLLYMLIINDTFGGYLGVLVSFIFLLIYSVASFIHTSMMHKKGLVNKKEKNCSIISLVIAIAVCTVFAVMTYTVEDANHTKLALRSLNWFTRDFGAFSGYVTTTENATEADVSSLDNSIAQAGSGRGRVWIKSIELVKQRPLFGYGLECLLFQFNGQFGINEGRTHNLLLQLLATVGIPGTAMYFIALAIIFIRLIKNWKTWDSIEKICFFVGVSYLVTALTGNSTYYSSPYFMIFLGFAVLTPWKRNKETLVKTEVN